MMPRVDLDGVEELPETPLSLCKQLRIDQTYYN